jgi:hypothetical protein
MRRDLVEWSLGRPLQSNNFRFVFGGTTSEQRFADEWEFWTWDGPFFVYIGYDERHQVAWKYIKEPILEKLGAWFFKEHGDLFPAGDV